jgi:nicotinate-nucleotide adenylyltransferase
MASKPKRIGVFAGTFDPVHAGHIAFAHATAKDARLDSVLFLPERKPRHKQGVTSFEHRKKMLEIATAPFANLHVLELPEEAFTAANTLPHLQQLYPNSMLVLLLGSDVATHVLSWPNVDLLLRGCELAVGVRTNYEYAVVEDEISVWPIAPLALTVIQSPEPYVSSSKVRRALRNQSENLGVIDAVKVYADQTQLYRLHRF